MCRIPLTDKGWLRQHFAQPSKELQARFERAVDVRLNANKNPTTKDINNARLGAYQNIMGVVA